MSGRAVVPPRRERIPRNAKAAEQLTRLLDALMLLEAEGSYSLGQLADHVGLAPDHLRDMISAWMVAPADMVGSTGAAFSVVFGTSAGPLDTDDEHFDDAFDAADHVWLDAARTQRVSLLDDVGQRPMTVDEVASGLLALAALRARDDLAGERRPELDSLTERLSAALGATVEPALPTALHLLSVALTRRQRVQLAYRDPWSGTTERTTAAVYDVYQLRDRWMADASADGADGFRTFEVSGVEAVTPVGVDHSYEVPALPPHAERHGTIEIVVRVPQGSGARTRLLRSWSGVEVATDDRAGTADVRIPVDRPARERVGVLLAQLGPAAVLVGPPEHLDLADAGADVARRVLAAHGWAE